MACTLTPVLILAMQASRPAADDPYALLRLYNGTWDIASGAEQKITHVENHCTKTGLFFVCEQIVSGKSEALVVFLPLARILERHKHRNIACKRFWRTPAPPGSGACSPLMVTAGCIPGNPRKTARRSSGAT